MSQIQSYDIVCEYISIEQFTFWDEGDFCE